MTHQTFSHIDDSQRAAFIIMVTAMMKTGKLDVFADQRLELRQGFADEGAHHASGCRQRECLKSITLLNASRVN